MTSTQVREFDRLAAEVFGLPTLLLMENAGRSVADEAERLNPDRGLVLIVCGRGNNGGDGLVAARHLDARGVPVRVWLWADPAKLTSDAATNLAVLHRAKAPEVVVAGLADLPRFAEALADAAVIVDALVGVGFRGRPRSPLDGVTAAVNAARGSGAKVLAVDVPSGLDADTGTPADPCVRADVTVTFVAPKAGFDRPAAAGVLGVVRVADLGTPRRLAEQVGLAGPTGGAAGS